MSAVEPLKLWNGRAFDAERLPRLAPEAFNDAVQSRLASGWRLLALFGVPRPQLPLPLLAFLSHPDGGWVGGLATEVGEEYPSLTLQAPQASRFEREIAEQFGVRPAGHPWLKPLRWHAPYGPGRFTLRAPDAEIGDGYPFFALEGRPVHEVAVGPVHAGVIEPGHFRFQCHGEVVHHLEIMLGYQHRGLERALLGGPHRASLSQIEELSGDSTVAHTLACCQALEALAPCAAPPRAQALRAVALELERLANHTGDLGALAGDIAFLPTASACGRLRGSFLNLTAELCGNRFGRGYIRPGGVSADLAAADVRRVLGALDRVEADLRAAAERFFSAGSVLGRLEGVGVLAQADAIALGVVGVAARACGLEIDARRDHASGMYRLSHIPVATAGGGDVHARALVRWLEIQRSLAFVRATLRELPAGEAKVACAAPRPGAAVLSITEGWRGEAVHVALTDGAGALQRYKVIDPSFRNWPALELVMRGGQISDFPLCNKSFNLSYSGHDL